MTNKTNQKNKEEESKEIVKYDSERFLKYQSLGMKKVDPQDIRPPTVILMNTNSNVKNFVDQEGNNPKPGEFFHNGTLRILPEFECYFVWAGKGKFVDKRSPEKGEQDVYRAIGVMADDFSIFGMRFKVSSLYTLSPLFTAVTANKRGMYSIKCKMKSKYLSGKKGDWYIPTLSIVGFETDPEKLEALEKIALNYDKLGIKAAPEGENEEDLDIGDQDESVSEEIEDSKMNENINPEDIPF